MTEALRLTVEFPPNWMVGGVYRIVDVEDDGNKGLTVLDESDYDKLEEVLSALKKVKSGLLML